MSDVKFGNILRENSNNVREMLVAEYMHEFEEEMDQSLFFEASLGRREYNYDPETHFRDDGTYTRFRKDIESSIESWIRKNGLQFRKETGGQYIISWENDCGEETPVLANCLRSAYRDSVKFLTTDFYDYLINITKESLLAISDKGLYECDCCVFDMFEDYLKEKAVTMADHVDTIWFDRNKEYYAFVKEWAEGEAINIQIMINTKTDKEYIRFSW